MQAKKVLGQNFLTDKNKVNEIIESIPNLEGSTVIEVGPGMGAITFPLSDKAYKVTAIEIDSDMIDILEEKNKPNLKVINKDILAVTWDEVIEQGEGNINFVSNLPYYISTKIMFKVASDKRFATMSVMLQKELVDRIFAKTNTKQFGRLTVAINSLYELLKRIDVPATCFTPKPNVESGFIVLRRKDTDFEVDEYLNFIKSCFANKRKTIMNSIKNSGSYNRDKLTEIFNEMEIPLNIRAEQIEVQTYIEIWKTYNK